MFKGRSRRQFKGEFERGGEGEGGDRDKGGRLAKGEGESEDKLKDNGREWLWRRGIRGQQKVVARRRSGLFSL